MIRLDGPGGGHTTPPAWATPEMLSDAVHTAAARSHIDGPEIDGRTYSFGFGKELDVRVIQSAAFQDGTTITEGKVAGYVAKYATKGAESAAGTLDHRLKLIAELGQETIPDHPARMIRTAWALGALREARAAWHRRHAPTPEATTLVLAHWAFDGTGLTPDLERLTCLVGSTYPEAVTARA